MVEKRALNAVPGWVMGLLAASLAAQLALRSQQPLPQARAQDMPAAPSLNGFRLAGLGDPLPLAGATMMWLQAFDNQPGVSVPYRELDFERATRWLKLILTLDPNSNYPLLVASRVYGEVPDPARQRLMLAFVAREFEAAPAQRWPWMAHAALVAKHKLKDQALALQLARSLRHYGEAYPAVVPAWARQMEIAVLEDLGEDEAAKILIGGLLQSGKIKDTQELRFLEERLLRDKSKEVPIAQ
jgi:hypothetical protein